MSYIKESSGGNERPAPRPNPPTPKPAAPRPRTVRGGGIAASRAASFKAASKAPPRKRSGLEQPDPATKRLLQLSTDQNGRFKPGTASTFLFMAKSLANRGGMAGANAYVHLAGAGVPIADLGIGAQKNASSFLRGLAQRGVDIGHVPSVEVLQPGERSTLHAALKKRGVDPGAGATDAQLLNALHAHKPRLTDVVTNIPKSAGKALVGLPMGAWGAGQVAGAAAFNHDLGPAKQAGKGFGDFYHHIASHPLGALEEDPVGTVMAVLPAKTIVGGFAGQAARAGLLGGAARTFAKADRAPLVLPKAKLSNAADEAPQVIPAAAQTPLSTNLIDRSLQRANAALTAKSATRSRGAVKRLSSTMEAQSRHSAYQNRERILGDSMRAKKGLSKAERRAATAFGQGVTPSQLAEYYKIALGENPASKHLKAQADLWSRIAEKVPTVTPGLQRYLDVVRPAVKEREASLQRVTDVGDSTLANRETIVRDEVQQKLHAAGSPLADQHAPDPFYFPHVGDTPNFSDFLFRRGMNPTRRLNPQLKKNDLALFKSGKWQPDVRHLEARISAAPLAEESLNHLQSQIKAFGRRVPAGTEYDPQHATLVRLNPVGAKVPKTDNSGAGLAQQIRDVRASSSGDKDFLQRLDSQIVVHTHDHRVPEGEDAVLVPNEVMSQVRGTLRSMNRGGLLRGAQTATDAWRYMTLYLRGGYLTTNITGNTAQAAVGGVGPVNLVRGFMPKYHDVVPQHIIGSGTMSELGRVQRLGGNAETTLGRGLNAVADSPVGRGIRFGVDRNPIMRWNVSYENALRRAIYLRHAIPAAKTAAGGSRVSRLTDEVMTHLHNNEVPQATQKVVDFLGDYTKKNRPNARLTVPFFRWVGFITKLSLVTLPLKHPVRNELLQALGRAGNAELAKMGLTPDWLQGAVPVGTSQQNVGGQPHQMANLLSTQALNPFATVNQTFGRGPAGVVSSLNPLLSSGLSTAFGRDLETGFDLRDKNGNPISLVGGPGGSSASSPTFWKTLLNQEVRNVPLVNLLDPQTGKSDEMLPFTGTRKTGKGLHQPNMPMLNNAIAYLSGIRVRPTDLTLYNMQQAYNLLGTPKAAAALGLSDGDVSAMRHRLSVAMGKAKSSKKGPAGSTGSSPSGGYSTPDYSQPTYSVPSYTP